MSPDTLASSLTPQIRGELLIPSSPGYDQARRIWNGLIDKRPAAILRAQGVADVQAAVRLAAENNLLLAIRGGGHNVAGTALCDGGLVIDLSRMKGAFVDPVNRTVRAQAGMTWGEFDRETQVYGLATTGGLVSTTGISGFTLGGGYGWLMGRFGLTCDNVRSCEVVTANGEVRTASTAENPDLFWALRGGGGNFGVVTSFEYQLHPVRTVISGMLLHPLSAARDVLRFYRDFTSAGLPEELVVYAGIISTPDGMPVTAIVLCYSGEDLDHGAKVIEPLRKFGTPLADMLQPMPYLAMQGMLDAAAPYGIRSYWKACFLNDLSDAAIDTFVDFSSRRTSPRTLCLLEHCHGAVSRPASDAMAMGLRRTAHDLVVLSLWDEGPGTEHIQWTREFYEGMEPHSAGSVYVNGLSADDTLRVREAYGDNYPRLLELKQKYDPDNLFRVNQNIRSLSAVTSG